LALARNLNRLGTRLQTIARNLHRHAGSLRVQCSRAVGNKALFARLLSDGPVNDWPANRFFTALVLLNLWRFVCHFSPIPKNEIYPRFHPARLARILPYGGRGWNKGALQGAYK
jgi:hypothetical protein